MIIHRAKQIVALILELMKILLLMFLTIPVIIAILQSRIAILVQIQPNVMIIFF